jgi:hypothetical protein
MSLLFYLRTFLNLRKNEIGSVGGASIASALEFNHTLKVLCLTDNLIGPTVISLISGRLSGGISDVHESVCASELVFPLQYEEGRYDRLELKNLMRLREERLSRCAIKNVRDADKEEVDDKKG